MKPESRTLSFALGFSLLLHSLPLVPALLPQKTPPPPPQPPVLTARLEAAPQPELQFKEVQSKAAAEPPAPKNKVLSSTVGTGKPPSARDAVKQAQAQIASKLLYPPEAVRRGLEGETLVMVFLDESGNAIAARVEASSGHGILDEAATRAAKLIRGLPDAAPREVALPVRFRLN